MEEEIPKDAIVRYVASEPVQGKWIKRDEIRFRLLPGEFSLIYAANFIRLETLRRAEKTFKNYRHPEPFKIGGREKFIEIGSAVKIIERPPLVGVVLNSSESEKRRAVLKAEEKEEKRVPREVGIQLIVSLDWLNDMSKARPSEINKKTSQIEYDVKFLPENTMQKEEEAISGYNNKQIALLERTLKIVLEVGGENKKIKSRWGALSVAEMGQRVSALTQKVLGSLPDPDEEEKQKQNAMIQEGLRMREEEDE